MFSKLANALIISAAPEPTIGIATPRVETFVITDIANPSVASNINSGSIASILSNIYLNKLM